MYKNKDVATLQNIRSILPRTDAWTELGRTVDLVLTAEDPFRSEDSKAPTLPLEALPLMNTIKMPSIRRGG